MKRFNYTWISMIAMMLLLSSCSVFGDVFKAGMVTTIIIIVIVIALILFLVSRFRK